MVSISKETIVKYTGIAGKGIAKTFLPLAMKGALVEFFKEKKVGIEKATDWVNTNKSIWGALSPDRQAQFKNMAAKIGDMEFLTADWVIDALKKDCPLLASLFMGWKKGHNWLARQVETIKKETSSEEPPLDK